MERKSFRNILNCESALSEIIGSIMFLAIAVSMIALIQTQSVPEWNKAVEMDHFNVVYDDYLKIKSDIEDAALFQFPKSGVIHMGVHYPDRFIFINPVDTSGTLTSKKETWIKVNYTPFNGSPMSFNISSTRITFEPNYNYYSNAPSLVYEHGLVIKDFIIGNYLYTDTYQAVFTNNTVNVLILDYPEESMSFSDINALNYNPQSINSTKNNTNVTVTFYTNYPQLWNALLKKDNLNYNISGNMITVIYTGATTINTYIVNGSIVSGIGVSAIPATPAPTLTPTPTPTPTPITARAVSLANITVLSLTTMAGTNATYFLNLTNNGTDTDSYILSVSNLDIASVAGLNISSPYVLNAGQSRIFTLNVTNTSAGGPFRVNVTATSVNDSTKSGYINTTTIVTSYGVNNVTYYLENNATALSVGADGTINYSASNTRITVIPYKNILKNGTMGAVANIRYATGSTTTDYEVFRFYLPFNYTADTRISANSTFNISWWATATNNRLNVSLIDYNPVTGAKTVIGRRNFTATGGAAQTTYSYQINHPVYIVPTGNRLMFRINTTTPTAGVVRLYFNSYISNITVTETQIG